MTLPSSGSQYLRINADSIITDPQSEHRVIVLHSEFDLFGMGVAKCVADRLASDPVAVSYTHLTLQTKA